MNVSNSGTLGILEEDLQAENLTRIELRHGDHQVILERNASNSDWNMPGNWPTRKPEVEELVRLLTGLHSRFDPIALGDPPDLEKFGLDKPLVVVKVRAGDSGHTLAFGKGKEAPDREASGTDNPFTTPVFLRLDKKPEVIRLAPGLASALMHGPDYYQYRRLFPPGERAKEGGPQDKVKRLAVKDVKELAVKSAAGSYTLAPSPQPLSPAAGERGRGEGLQPLSPAAGERGRGEGNDEWELRATDIRDRADPDRIKAIREVVPDIWAEFFVEKPKKDLDEYGLKETAQTISLKRPDGGQVTLLIGKESRTKKRTVTRPAPPGLPMPPQQETVNEVYRYAKLQDNDQIFEIKPDKLNKDVFVAVDTLRDPRLARFRSEDARRVEITQGRAGDVSPPMIVLVKDKDKWRLQKPQEADAEGDKINELIDRLSSLQAHNKDVIDKADAKTYGFDQPAGTVKVTVEEEVKGEGDSKTKTTKVFTFVLGKHDAEKKKLYVRMEGWDRVNAVDESGGEKSVPALVKRPTLAYRALQLWSWQPADLASVRVQKLDQEPYRLERKDRGWHISEPFEADAPASRVQPIEMQLAGLRCERFRNPGRQGIDRL